MAVDYRQLTEDLSRFYNFTGKVVLFVGAGGRQLLGSSIRTKKLITIDQDAESLRELKTEVAARGRDDSVEVIAAGFEKVTL